MQLLYMQTYKDLNLFRHIKKENKKLRSFNEFPLILCSDDAERLIESRIIACKVDTKRMIVDP